MFASSAKNILRRAPLSARATAPSILSRAFASDGLEAFGRNKFMGDVADEFLKPHGMSWADMEDGTWTTDMAKADKVKYRTLKRRVAFYFIFLKWRCFAIFLVCFAEDCCQFTATFLLLPLSCHPIFLLLNRSLLLCSPGQKLMVQVCTPTGFSRWPRTACATARLARCIIVCSTSI